MVDKYKPRANTEVVQNLARPGWWDDALEHVPEQTLCKEWLLYAFFLVLSFCLEDLCSASLPNTRVEWSSLEESSLPWGIWCLFTSERKTSFGSWSFVLLHSSTFFAGGAKLGSTTRAQQVKWFCWLSSAWALMSLILFPVSRRAWEVWLHSRVCHTWTSLWCAKGKLYKVHSLGLCLPLLCF